jgi:hypothetical protein
MDRPLTIQECVFILLFSAMAGGVVLSRVLVF